MRYLLVSHTIKRGFEFTDYNCYQNLKKKLNIRMLCLVRNANYGAMSAYKKLVKNKIEKESKDIIWVQSEDEIKLSLVNYDVIIISNIQGSKTYAEFAKKIGKIVILLDTYFNQDFSGNPTSDLIIFKNYNSKKIFDNINKKKDNYDYKISGCIQTLYLGRDFILNKSKFYQKYNLDKKKFNCLFLPCGPQHHTQKFKDLYRKICDLVNKHNYNNIIKLHPTEYNLTKLKKFYKNKKSNSILKRVKHKVIDPSDFYSAILNSKFILAIDTNSFHEVNLLDKPIIYVERLNLYNIKFSKDYFIDRKKFKVHKYINNYIFDNLTKNNPYHVLRNKSLLKYYGCETQIKDLSNLLTTKTKKTKFKLSKKFKKEISPIIYNKKKSFSKLSEDIDNFCRKKIKKEKNINHIKHIHFLKAKTLIKKYLRIKSY